MGLLHTVEADASLPVSLSLLLFDLVFHWLHALTVLQSSGFVVLRRSLLRAGTVVRPLRVAAETARAAARAAGDLDDDGDRSTQRSLRPLIQ